MDIIELKPPYGRIQMNLLNRDDLSANQKLVYAIISAKQGETQYAKLTQKMIADAIGISEHYVQTTIKELISLGLVQKKKSEYVITNRGRQYGMVELDFLIIM